MSYHDVRGIIIEFKVAENETEGTFQEAVIEALAQIQDKNYKAEIDYALFMQFLFLFFLEHQSVFVNLQVQTYFFCS